MSVSLSLAHILFPPLLLQQVSQSHSEGWNIFLHLIHPSQPFSLSPRPHPHPLLLFSPSVSSGSAVLLSVCWGQIILHANIHSAIISNLFHTRFGVSFCLTAALVLIVHTALLLSHSFLLNLRRNDLSVYGIVSYCSKAVNISIRSLETMVSK